MGDLAGDLEVRGDRDGRAAVGLDHRGEDVGRCVPGTALVATGGGELHRAVGLVHLDHRRRSGIFGDDRADLDLHRAFVGITVLVDELGAGKAGSDRRDVGEKRPGFLHGGGNVHVVLDAHGRSVPDRFSVAPGRLGCMAMSAHPSLSSVDAVTAALADHDYLADRGLATTIFLAASLHRPLLLEGEAGVGKTEVAKVLAAMTGAELIRLQCYEGIDANQALYEWNYTAQLLHLRTAEATGTATAAGADELEEELFSERFLVRRPLLRAIDHGGGVPPVLLIDEIDRADDEFEAFLLEALSDFSITIPELGTFTAEVPPIVIITSNRTRDVHDALKRRALHHWVDHPDFEREVAIVRAKAPAVPERLARQTAVATGVVRELGMYKPPGVAETLDWANAMHLLGATELTEETVDATLGTLLKYREDQEKVRREGLQHLLTAAGA